MPRTRSQTAALLAQQITELAMGDMTSRITNTPNKKHKTPPNKQNTPKKKKKRRKRGSSLSMRKKATNTKGQGDGSENNPYTATRRSTKRRIKQSNLNEKRRHETQKNAIRKEIQCEFEELNVFINRIGNENAKVNLYKKKCEFYADRLRFFKYCINEKLTVNLSGAKCTLELLQKECYRLIDKHKIYSEPQVHIHKMSEVLTEIKNPIGIFDTTVAQQGHYSYHYDGVRHQRRKVANEDDK
eukprot:693874_1